MEIEKVKIQHPMTMDIEEIKSLAQKIRSKNIPFDELEDEFPNYWLVTVSPYGKIIEPTEEDIGHPQLVQSKIYKKDKFFDFIEKNFYPCGGSIHRLRILSVNSGYLDLDGFNSPEDGKEQYQLKLNPFALTIQTERIYKDMKEYATIYSMADGNECGDENMIDALYIGFIKQKLLKSLDEKGLRPNEIDKLFSSYQELIDYKRSCEQNEYAKIVGKILNIFNVNSFAEIADKKINLFDELQKKFNCSAVKIWDYLEKGVEYEHTEN